MLLLGVAVLIGGCVSGEPMLGFLGLLPVLASTFLLVRDAGGARTLCFTEESVRMLRGDQIFAEFSYKDATVREYENDSDQGIVVLDQWTDERIYVSFFLPDYLTIRRLASDRCAKCELPKYENLPSRRT